MHKTNQIAVKDVYHRRRLISIPTGSLTWLRFSYVFEKWYA
jgi:hypothetical protein